MKRRIFKLTLFLLAGAIINIAVAWGCAYFVSFGEAETLVRVGNKDFLLFRYAAGSESADRGAYMRDAMQSWMEGSAPTQVVEVGKYNAKPRWKTIIEGREISGYEARGWPCFALTWFYLGGGPDNPIRKVPEVRYGIHIQGSQDLHRYKLNGRVLPLRPIFPGFAINTIFYAAILYALFAVPGAVRRRLRTKLGQCASCGYSLRGTSGSTCPECGATA